VFERELGRAHAASQDALGDEAGSPIIAIEAGHSSAQS